MTATVLPLQKARVTSASVAADAVWPSSPSLEDDDLALIRRVAAKDRQAFEVLYHRYARRLYGYLAKLIRQQEIIEEVLEEPR